MKKIWKYIEGVNGVLLILYSLFVLGTHAYLKTVNKSTWMFCAILAVILIASIIICPLLLRLVRKITIPRKNILQVKSHKFGWFLLFFVISFFVFLVFYAAYYPGGFSADSIDQYTQALNGRYKDWHPVLHTLLVFKLPLTLTNGWGGSVVFFQILWFSLVLAYMAYSILMYSNKLYAFIALFFILANPVTGNIAMYPWKDVAFTIVVLLLMVFTLHVYFTKGAWLNNPLRVLGFGAALMLASVFRHNGILFTVPLAFAILFYAKKEKGWLVIVSFAVLMFIVKVPLYSALNVKEAESRQSEMLGLPMTVIGEVVTRNPDSMDEEIREFAYSVAPEELWESKYDTGNFDSIKWDSNTSVIDEAGAVKVLQMMQRCIVTSPKESFIGLITLTDMVYTITSQVDWVESPYILENDHGLSYSGVSILRSIIERYTSVTRLFLRHIFWYVGTMNFILLICILASCRLDRFSDWKRVLLGLPVFVYNFGTMLLLTLKTDFRFFYYSFPVIPVLILIMLNKENEEEGERG